MRYDRLRLMVALAVAAAFIIPGLAILFGDPANAKAATMQTSIFYELVRDATGLLGKNGAGFAFILTGSIIGAVLVKASRD